MVQLTKTTKSVSALSIKRTWHHIDVKNKVLGRAASDIAEYLIGKHKTNYVSYLDVGDHVVVTNAKAVALTGKKETDKIYTRYSGYPGGLTKVNVKTMREKNPTFIIRNAVYGMLPKNKLRDKRIRRLFIYPGDEHPYKDKFKD